jgi:phosphate transport system permease protein
MPTLDRATLRRVKRHDRLARWVIVAGGLTVIASVIAILVLIVSVTAPLFRGARSRELARVPLPASEGSRHTPCAVADGTRRVPATLLAVGIDMPLGEQSPVAHVLGADGHVTFVDLATGASTARQAAPPPSPGSRVVAVERHAGSRYSLLWSDGAVSLIEVLAAAQAGPQGGSELRGAVKELASIPAEPGQAAVAALLRVSAIGTTTCVRLLPSGGIAVFRIAVSENLLGEKETTSKPLAIDTAGLTPISAITMDTDGGVLYVGTRSGQLARWQFAPEGNLKAAERFTAFHDGRAVTALAMVFGDVSLAVGDDRGGLSVWFPVRREGKALLTQVHTLASHAGAVREILPSLRTKSLLSIGDDGSVHLDHVTSQRHLLSWNLPAAPARIGFAPRGDGWIALTPVGHVSNVPGTLETCPTDCELVAWDIDAPHPEVSWKTLFGKVHYEGYSEADWSWQTTGGDDFEAKLSLVPLISGTLKGTAYAMLLAVPLALLGAVYTSYFTTPGFKQAIKPTVEIMAAIPSVVLGFLVALWLAPIVERWILAVFLAFVTLPATLVAFLAVWQLVRRYDWAKRIENGYEFLVLVPVILLGVWLAVLLAPWVESIVFDGHFRLWLYQSLGMRYDQRNCIIIAFGLGFAVIPIIFSIAEDSLSSVPYTLSASSMALGASRWQTLWRVVLPSASPGIFAGIMIGFGRAVGETMIVLMATGNTPILDWSPFNGMRTLSANIAVEIVEAPVGGTLYRVLFLCAVLLFLLTFALNTAAELVRQRLRQRYSRF